MSWISKLANDITGKSAQEKASDKSRGDANKRLKLAQEAASKDNFRSLADMFFPGIFPIAKGATGTAGSSMSSQIQGEDPYAMGGSGRREARSPVNKVMISDSGVDAGQYADPNSVAGVPGGQYTPFPYFGSPNTRDYVLGGGSRQRGGEPPLPPGYTREPRGFGPSGGLDSEKHPISDSRRDFGMWQARNPGWMGVIRFLGDRLLPGLGTGIKLYGKRAEGGPVAAGEPYLVGEEGPEMMVPSGQEESEPMEGLEEMGMGAAPGGMPGQPLDQETLMAIVQLLLMLLQQSGGLEGIMPEGGAAPGMGEMLPQSGEGALGPEQGMPQMPPGGGGGFPSDVAAGGLPPGPSAPQMPPPTLPEEIPGRALGGPVQKDRPYLVGEMGPEVVVPGKSGVVVPNNRLQQPKPWGLIGKPATAPPAQAGGTQPVQFPTTFAQTTPAPPTSTPQTAPSATPVPPPSMPQFDSPGQAVVWHIMNMLQNPGQTNTIGYERGQANAERTTNRMMNLASSGAAVGGIAPNSMAVRGAQMAALGKGGEMRADAIAKQTQLEEALKRQDIQQGAAGYSGALDQAMKMLQLQIAAVTGSPMPTVYGASGNNTAALAGDIASLIAAFGG